MRIIESNKQYLIFPLRLQTAKFEKENLQRDIHLKYFTSTEYPYIETEYL